MRLGQYTTDRGRCCSESCGHHTAQKYHPLQPSQRNPAMQQKQEENASDTYKNLLPDVWENSLRRLSDRAQAVFHAVIT